MCLKSNRIDKAVLLVNELSPAVSVEDGDGQLSNISEELGASASVEASMTSEGN